MPLSREQTDMDAASIIAAMAGFIEATFTGELDQASVKSLT